MFDLLENIEKEVNPTKDHWIFPGMVRHGIIIGVSGAEVSLLLAELAVAAATYTPFLGQVEPDLVPVVLYVPRDVYKAIVTVKRLLAGRNLSGSPKTLRIASGDIVHHWNNVEDEAVANSAIVVIDQSIIGVESGLKRLTEKGITSVIRGENEINDFTIRSARDFCGNLSVQIEDRTVQTSIKRSNEKIIFTTPEVR